MTEYFPCPACGTKSTLKHHVVHSTKAQLFFQCRNNDCRNHFQVLRMTGQLDRVVAQSPRQVIQPAVKAEDHIPLIAAMGCPDCGTYGKIRSTERRDDGYWRRHICAHHGAYYTCEADGDVSVHKRKLSRKAIAA